MVKMEGGVGRAGLENECLTTKQHRAKDGFPRGHVLIRREFPPTYRKQQHD